MRRVSMNTGSTSGAALPLQLDPARARHLREGLQRIRDEIGQRGRRPFQLQAARVQLGHLEKIIDQRRKRLDIALGRGEIAAHRFRFGDHAVAQRLQDGAHGGQRRLQVVSHPGDQVEALLFRRLQPG